MINILTNYGVIQQPATLFHHQDRRLFKKYQSNQIIQMTFKSL